MFEVAGCTLHVCFTHTLIHAVWQLACAAKPTLSTQCRRRGRRPTAARTRCKSSARAAQSSAGSRSATTRDKRKNKRLLWHKPNTAAAHNRLRAAGRSVCNEQRCNGRTSLQHAPCNSRPAKRWIGRGVLAQQWCTAWPRTLPAGHCTGQCISQRCCKWERTLDTTFSWQLLAVAGRRSHAVAVATDVPAPARGLDHAVLAQCMLSTQARARPHIVCTHTQARSHTHTNTKPHAQRRAHTHTCITTLSAYTTPYIRCNGCE